MRRSEFINVILAIPKSLYFNFKVFGVKKGINLPVLISHKTKIKRTYKGCIELQSPLKFGMVKIGINEGPFERGRGKKSYINIELGKVKFRGKANIASDSVLNVSSGLCIFGENFVANNGFVCSCENNINFGNNVLVAWNCVVIDGDGHKLIDNKNNEIINMSAPIFIGSNVWIAAKSTILKGSVIKNNCVVALGSIVNSRINEDNVILAGTPARVVKNNISWIR